jgi:hypothetical protein
MCIKKCDDKKISFIEIMIKWLKTCYLNMKVKSSNFHTCTLSWCEATFRLSTPSFTRWLCLKAQMLLVKENTNVFQNASLRL